MSVIKIIVFTCMAGVAPSTDTCVAVPTAHTVVYYGSYTSIGRKEAVEKCKKIATLEVKMLRKLFKAESIPMMAGQNSSSCTTTEQGA